MDLSFKFDNNKFNYRVCGLIIKDNKILAMKDEISPYYYLPGGRVSFGETAEEAIVRELSEEIGINAKVIRPLWLNQAFFKNDVTKIDFHELCIYFLMAVEEIDELIKTDKFERLEGKKVMSFEWLDLKRLKDEYFYPVFLKEEIFNLPEHFTIRVENE